jgi:hypothetical protein
MSSVAQHYVESIKAPREAFPRDVPRKSAPAPEIHGSHATSSVPETGVSTMAKKTGDPLRHQ